MPPSFAPLRILCRIPCTCFACIVHFHGQRHTQPVPEPFHVLPESPVAHLSDHFPVHPIPGTPEGGCCTPVHPSGHRSVHPALCTPGSLIAPPVPLTLASIQVSLAPHAPRWTHSDTPCILCPVHPDAAQYPGSLHLNGPPTMDTPMGTSCVSCPGVSQDTSSPNPPMCPSPTLPRVLAKVRQVKGRFRAAPEDRGVSVLVKILQSPPVLCFIEFCFF